MIQTRIKEIESVQFLLRNQFSLHPDSEWDELQRGVAIAVQFMHMAVEQLKWADARIEKLHADMDDTN